MRGAFAGLRLPTAALRALMLLAALLAHQGARGATIADNSVYQSCLADTDTCYILYVHVHAPPVRAPLRTPPRVAMARCAQV